MTEILLIHKVDSHLPTDFSPYTTVRNQTPNNLFMGSKFLTTVINSWLVLRLARPFTKVNYILIHQNNSIIIFVTTFNPLKST